MEKLVRDQILEIEPNLPHRIAEPHEMKLLLARKLVEEANEVLREVLNETVFCNPPQDNTPRIIAEAADLIMAMYGFVGTIPDGEKRLNQVLDAREKAEGLDRFSKRIVMQILPPGRG